MKRLLSILIFIVSVLTSYAQIRISILNTNDSNSNTIHNGITFFRINNAPAKSKIFASDGNIQKFSEKEYQLDISSLCKFEKNIKLYIVLSSDTVDREILKLIPIEPTQKKPRIQIGNSDCGNATRKELLANPKISVEPNSCKVVSFSMTLLPKRGQWVGPLLSGSEKLTNEQMELITRSNKGDRINFEEVKIICQNPKDTMAIDASVIMK